MNPKDKNGNVLNIGDRVVYMKGTLDEDSGVITEFHDAFGDGVQRVYSCWSDNNGCATHCDPENVELIESSVTTAFTPEDEAMLQKLLAKKQQALHVKAQAEEDFNDLVMEIRSQIPRHKVSDYLAENIDKICATLQAYKQHCV